MLNKCIAICGDSASGKTVLAKLLAETLGEATILECDRYHLWERHDPCWAKYTQLNPLCNNLALLNRDVQALKNNETISRRNYDHHTGKFTEDEIIIPSKNIILCGLHAFLCPEGLYDLKIFIDTDPALKVEWKIARDTKVRGYTSEQVIKQIERRKEDYIRFIEPQKEMADIVINFYKQLDDIHIRLWYKGEFLDFCDSIRVVNYICKKIY